MTLDLASVVHQIDALISSSSFEREGERFAALHTAWQAFDDDEVNRRFGSARTSFLLARSSNAYRDFFALPDLPHEFTVVATDGSMIVPNRHAPARFYVINIGTVCLRYGPRSQATMTSVPDLRYAEEDLVVESLGRRIPVNEAIVGLRRAVAELSAAADAAVALEGPVVALIDGSLILWTLQGHDDTTVETTLGGYIEAMWRLKQQHIPVASYISSPGAADMMNTLRVSICDYPDHGKAINCDDCRMRILSERHVPACDILPGVTDGYLMQTVAALNPGERTTTYDSDSRILDQYGSDFRTRFFYLNAGREVARVEVPAWVADDTESLALVHAAIFDQCELGRGYPVALQEAHEMAVISMSDRQLVDELMERRMAAAGIIVTRSGKDGSKRGRFV